MERPIETVNSKVQAALGHGLVPIVCVGATVEENEAGRTRVMVILPLLFIDVKKPRQSLLIVILTSLWGGISRVNWFPMPAMIAVAIYLLETPLTSRVGEKISLRQVTSYLVQPTLWTIAGLASALFAQWSYVFISGKAQTAEAFTSSFTSDLLWYRLWSNENFPLGVMPAILIISGPLLITFIFAAFRWKSLHSIRWLGFIAMILALFAGSTVVFHPSPG